MIKINVGVRRATEKPLREAWCSVDLELDGSILEQDVDRLDLHIQQAYALCRRAVYEKMVNHHGLRSVRLGRKLPVPPENWPSREVQERQRRGKASAVQITFIRERAAQLGIDLPELLQRRCGVERPEDLGGTRAALLMWELTAMARKQSYQDEGGADSK